MSLYVRDLPTNPGPGVVLYCLRCQDSFSAHQGDYFLVPPDAPLTHCGYDMFLARKQIHFEEIAPDQANEED